MNELMFDEFKSILETVKGDIVDFRVYKGSTFGHFVKLGKQYNREVFGMDTFQGLPKPDKNVDKNINGYISYPMGYAKTSLDITTRGIKNISDSTKYHLYSGPLEETIKQIPSTKKFAIAFIDLLQYHTTKLVIDFIKDRMEDGGLIYFHNYNESDDSMANKAVNEFILENHPVKELSKQNNVIGNRRFLWNPPIKTEKKISKKEIIDTVPEITPIISQPKVTVALVLRSGGDTYNYRYVNALAANIRQQSTIPIKVVCLTDKPDNIDTKLVDEIIPLKHKFKGWWSKIELFRPDIFTTEKVVYFDLDTVIVSMIDDILSCDSEFAGIRDLYHWDIFQTGILVFDPKKNNQIYTNFLKNPEQRIMDYITGDAPYIRDNVTYVDFLQDIFPSKIVSYKSNCLNFEKRNS